MKVFQSIKVRLLIFILSISLMPIAAITTIYYLNARSALKYQILEKLRAVAESRRLHVHSFLEIVKARTVDFSTDGFIRNSFKRIVCRKTFKQDDVIRLNEYLSMNKLPLYRHLIAIALVDKYGKVISSTNEEFIGKDISSQDVFIQGIRKKYGESSVGQPQYSSDFDTNCIYVSAPITFKQGTKTIGIIINIYRLAALDEITTDRVGMGKTGEVYLVNRDKIMLTESRFIDDASLKQPVDTEPVQKIVKDHKEMVGIYPDYRKIPVVGASMEMREYGWTLLAEIDEAEAFAPLKTLSIFALIIGIVGVAAVAGVGIAFAISTSRPIRQLTDATKRFASGDLNYRIKVSRKDEIGALAISFNIMAEELEREITEHKRAKEELRKSETRFRALVETTSDWVWEVDQNVRYTYVSPKVKDFLGYEPEEVIGKSPFQLMPPDEAERIANLFGDIAKAQKPFVRLENVNIHKNRQKVVMETSGVPIFDASGNLIGYRGIDRDVTERKRIEEELRKLSNAVKQSLVSVVITDTKGNIEYVNPKFTQLTGYTLDEVIGKNPRILKSGKTSSSEYKRLWDTITSGREWRGEFCNKKKNGEFYWDYASISPIRNSEGVITHFLAVKEDINERKNFEAQLAHLANCDPLTNLLNRRRFHEELENWLAQVRRYGVNGALLFLDVDNFKDVNDTLSHQIGDKLLVDLAVLLRKRMRKTDTLARLGGDEFAIILPHTGTDQARSIAEYILDSIKNTIIVDKIQSHSITASIGIAMFPEHGYEAETLLSYADLALYKAKEEGRNRVCVFSPDHKIQIESRLGWERRIRDALENDRFALHFQPILDIRQNKIVGHEALLRMVGDKGELISPIIFLDIAEHCGLIREIDRWVVHRAIHFAAEQRFTERGLFLNVNLSGRSLTDPQLLPLIKQAFAETAINPQSLIFEITETAIIENITTAQRFIANLKAMGCRFALDDFGIGFSSFSHLKHLDVDYLKIDGGFIRDLTHDLVDQHLVKAIVEVSRGLGKQTVAEFVECKETIQLLLEYGVDYAQGYHIGLPSAVPEVQFR